MENNKNTKAENIAENFKKAFSQMMGGRLTIDNKAIQKITNDFYQSINPIEVQKKIRDFRRLNFKTISDGDLMTAIMNVLCINGVFSYPVNIQTIKKGSHFFRVRKLRGNSIPFENFNKISDMWEPPKEKITKRERLNKVGESLLYTTLANPFIAIQEARIHEGDTYALIKYVAKDDVKINVIGGDYDLNNIPFSDNNAIIVFNLINDFLRDEFSRDVGEGTEYLYRISENIAKDWFDLPPSDQHAWAYSSIQDKKIYNICFRPNIGHELLQLLGAQICKKDASEEIKVICIAVPSNEDESIEYVKLGTEIQKNIFPEIELTGDPYDQL